jgi:hypothetical protein
MLFNYLTEAPMHRHGSSTGTVCFDRILLTHPRT